MKSFSLIFLFLVVAVTSCTKDKVYVPNYELIEPLSYFPAYPGSIWIYSNNDTIRVSDNYETCIYDMNSNPATDDYDTILLPRIFSNGSVFPSGVFVKEYAVTNTINSNYNNPAFNSILSETIGGFYYGNPFAGSQVVQATVIEDTTILIGTVEYNNVLATIKYNSGCISFGGGTPEECATRRRFYAKDIGLIKQESKSALLTGYTEDFVITHYAINK